MLAVAGLNMSGIAHADDEAVSIAGLAFNPNSVTVNVGDTVTWTNDDDVDHTVTSDSAAWNVAGLGPTGQFTFEFITAGTYTYHCDIHPEMTGTVVVEEAVASPTTAGQTASTPQAPATGSGSGGGMPGGDATNWALILSGLGLLGAAAVSWTYSRR